MGGDQRVLLREDKNGCWNSSVNVQRGTITPLSDTGQFPALYGPDVDEASKETNSENPTTVPSQKYETSVSAWETASCALQAAVREARVEKEIV